MIVLRNPARRASIAICEVLTLLLVLTLWTASGHDAATNIAIGASVAIVGTCFWTYLFFGQVALRQDVLTVRWLKRVFILSSEIQAIRTDRDFLQPVVKTRDGQTVYLAPLVSPLAGWGIGRQRTKMLVERLASSLGVPIEVE
jgi:hypothetical protein